MPLFNRILLIVSLINMQYSCSHDIFLTNALDIAYVVLACTLCEAKEVFSICQV